MHARGLLVLVPSLFAILWLSGPAPSNAQMMDDPDAIGGDVADQLNPTQRDLSISAGAACAAGSGNDGNSAEFQERCDNLAGGTSGQRVDGVKELSPEQVASQGAEATKLSGGSLRQVAGNMVGRLAAVRTRRVAALEIEWQGEKAFYGRRDTEEALATGAAGEDDEDGGPRFGAYLSGTFGTGEVDNSNRLLGFDYDLGGLTAGADMAFETFVIGAAFSWIRVDSDFNSNAGDAESDSFNGSLYASWYPWQDLYFDGIVTFGGTEYDIKRKIQYTVTAETVETRAKSDPEGWQVGVTGGVGYDFAVEAWTISPYFRAAYARLEVDNFSETGGDGWGLRYDSQDVESVTTTLGGEVAYAISAPFGVVVPQLRGEYIHEFEDDDRRVGAIFRGDNTTQRKFYLRTDDADQDYFTLGTEVATTFAGGLGVFAAYDVLLGYEDVESHELTFGGRIEF